MKKIILFILTISFSTQLHSQQSWRILQSNLTNNYNGDICVINKDTVYVIADGGNFLKTVDGGKTWTTLSTGITDSFLDMQFIDANTGYAVGLHGKIIKTVNGGDHWDLLNSGVTTDLTSLAIVSSDKIWAVGTGGIILNSNNAGASWNKDDATTNRNLTGVRFRDSNIGFIVGEYSIVLGTTNGGVTWNNLNFGSTVLPFQFNQHSLSATSNRAYFISYDGYKHQEIYRTSNNQSWLGVYNMSSGIYIPWSGLYFVNDSTGYVMNSYCNGNLCGLNIFKTKNYGSSWVKYFANSDPIVTPNLGSGHGKFDFASDSVGFMLCGNVILTNTKSAVVIVTEVNRVTEVNKNDHFKIYPNPFSVEAIIKLEDVPQDAMLIVYNSLWQQVIRIDNISEQIITLHRNTLSSGLYFLQMIQGKRVIGVTKFVITD